MTDDKHKVKTIIAAYLGTFDPITLGHFDIISRAATIFHTLYIGIGTNKEKKNFFSVAERMAIIHDVCRNLPNVKVKAFSGLAVDFAKAVDASVLVRGLRTEADFVYELQMAMMNRTLDMAIDTVFVPTRQDLSHVSSSLVKEVALLGGNVHKLVPAVVAVALRKQVKKIKKVAGNG